MNIKKPLSAAGLSDKEISIYLVLLPLSSATLQDVAKRIDLPRTTVYNTLNYLITKGLVTTVTKNKVLHYSSVDPSFLVNHLDQKKKLLESVLPQLQLLQNEKTENSSVQLFSGFSGVYSIICDVFAKKQKTYYFGSYTKSLKILKHLPGNARTIRLERNISAEIIIDEDSEDIFSTKKYQKLTNLKILPSLVDFPVMIFIYGNKTAIYTLETDLAGLIIENSSVSKAMKLIFDVFWSQAKKI
jgi:sugar-specific transcriptional regulator TrmB